MLWVLAGAAAVTLFMFAQVDDWSRDLTTNVASTDPPTGDLQPLALDLSPEEALTKVRRSVANMPRWQFVDSSRDADQLPGTIVVHLVRTTPLMRFKDDIEVRLIPGPNQQSTTVHIRSQSRVGRGDLGQNPRNIRELLKMLSH